MMYKLVLLSSTAGPPLHVKAVCGVAEPGLTTATWTPCRSEFTQVSAIILLLSTFILMTRDA